MAKLKDMDGFHTYGWMVNQLGLDGGDLTAFALVYGFVKDFAGKFLGGADYLSTWTGWTIKTSRNHLDNLVNLGLLVKEKGRENNLPFCHYLLAPDFYEKHTVKTSVTEGKNYPQEKVKTSVMRGKKLPPRIEHIEEKKENNIPPTPQAVADYVRNMVKDPEGFALYYLTSMAANEWMRGKGKDRKPVTNWKNNVLQWVKYHKNEDFSYLKPVAPKGSTLLSTEAYNKMLNN